MILCCGQLTGRAWRQRSKSRKRLANCAIARQGIKRAYEKEVIACDSENSDSLIQQSHPSHPKTNMKHDYVKRYGSSSGSKESDPQAHQRTLVEKMHSLPAPRTLVHCVGSKKGITRGHNGVLRR